MTPRTMHARLITLALSAILAVSLLGETLTASDRRRHATIDNSIGNAEFTVTVIKRLSQEADATTVLLRDERTRRLWVLERRMDYAAHLSSYEIRDRSNGNVYLRFSYPLMFNGRTRDAILAEARANRAAVEAEDAIVTLETESFSRTARQSGWMTHRDEWRDEFRVHLSPRLYDVVERMRPLYGDFLQMFYAQMFVRVLKDDSATVTLTVNAASPDCLFDAEFGFPCKADQLERVRSAAGAGPLLVEY